METRIVATDCENGMIIDGLGQIRFTEPIQTTCQSNIVKIGDIIYKVLRIIAHNEPFDLILRLEVGQACTSWYHPIIDGLITRFAPNGTFIPKTLPINMCHPYMFEIEVLYNPPRANPPTLFWDKNEIYRYYPTAKTPEELLEILVGI